MKDDLLLYFRHIQKTQLELQGICCNLSLALMTKARACKGAGQEWRLGITFHAPGSVGEGMNPTFPSELPFWEFLEGNYRDQNSLD
jgi:hypothetical protein